MLNFEYVMSAMAMTRIVMMYDKLPFYPTYCQILSDLTRETINRLKETNTNTHSSISCLYNGFTEKELGERFSKRNKNGCDNVYADSGGLQIITQGKTITPELKLKVYESQSYADYGFCFDTIPLKTISATRGSSERTNVKNKLFTHADLKDAAKQTSKDIITQLKFFEDKNVDTKGMIILQGNIWSDMVEWFDYIVEEIPDSLNHRIAGIAAADTCMGNGELETVEMMKAVRAINQKYGDFYTNHVHLLGVGSIGRLMPTVNMMKSGYADFIQKLSYDSTSHTSGAYMGRLFENGSHMRIPNMRNHKTEETFRKIYARHSKVFGSIMGEDEFLKFVFSKPGSGIGAVEKWDTSFIIKHVNPDDHYETSVVKLIPYAYILYCVENFMTTLDQSCNLPINKNDPISILSTIKTDDDMDNWFKSFRTQVKSNRISRQLNTVDKFFGE